MKSRVPSSGCAPVGRQILATPFTEWTGPIAPSWFTWARWSGSARRWPGGTTQPHPTPSFCRGSRWDKEVNIIQAPQQNDNSLPGSTCRSWKDKWGGTVDHLASWRVKGTFPCFSHTLVGLSLAYKDHFSPSQHCPVSISLKRSRTRPTGASVHAFCS